MRGTLSKRRFKGAGRAGALLVGGARAYVQFAFDSALASVSSVLSSDCIVGVHAEYSSHPTVKSGMPEENLSLRAAENIADAIHGICSPAVFITDYYYSGFHWPLYTTDSNCNSVDNSQELLGSLNKRSPLFDSTRGRQRYNPEAKNSIISSL